MKERTTKNIMLGLMSLGALLIFSGLYLAIFTNISTSNGTNGIFTIAGLIAAGLFISVPAKLYLTFQIMKQNDDMLKTKNESIKNK